MLFMVLGSVYIHCYALILSYLSCLFFNNKNICGDGIADRSSQHDLQGERCRTSGLARFDRQSLHYKRKRSSDRFGR